VPLPIAHCILPASLMHPSLAPRARVLANRAQSCSYFSPFVSSFSLR
jgi:hypothetical protein